MQNICSDCFKYDSPRGISAVSGANYIASPPGRGETISSPTSFSSVQFTITIPIVFTIQNVYPLDQCMPLTAARIDCAALPEALTRLPCT